jgi:hypothetical protein
VNLGHSGIAYKAWQARIVLADRPGAIHTSREATRCCLTNGFPDPRMN